MDPDKGLVRLRELAAKGIKVTIPDSVFRTVSLPARLLRSVQVTQHEVGLRLKAESLRVQTASVLSSVSIEVLGFTKPEPAGGSPGPK